MGSSNVSPKLKILSNLDVSRKLKISLRQPTAPPVKVTATETEMNPRSDKPTDAFSYLIKKADAQAITINQLKKMLLSPIFDIETKNDIKYLIEIIKRTDNSPVLTFKELCDNIIRKQPDDGKSNDLEEIIIKARGDTLEKETVTYEHARNITAKVLYETMQSQTFSIRFKILIEYLMHNKILDSDTEFNSENKKTYVKSQISIRLKTDKTRKDKVVYNIDKPKARALAVNELTKLLINSNIKRKTKGDIYCLMKIIKGNDDTPIMLFSELYNETMLEKYSKFLYRDLRNVVMKVDGCTLHDEKAVRIHTSNITWMVLEEVLASTPFSDDFRNLINNDIKRALYRMWKLNWETKPKIQSDFPTVPLDENPSSSVDMKIAKNCRLQFKILSNLKQSHLKKNQDKIKNYDNVPMPVVINYGNMPVLENSAQSVVVDTTDTIEQDVHETEYLDSSILETTDGNTITEVPIAEIAHSVEVYDENYSYHTETANNPQHLNSLEYIDSSEGFATVVVENTGAQYFSISNNQDYLALNNTQDTLFINDVIQLGSGTPAPQNTLHEPLQASFNDSLETCMAAQQGSVPQRKKMVQIVKTIENAPKQISTISNNKDEASNTVANTVTHEQRECDGMLKHRDADNAHLENRQTETKTVKIIKELPKLPEAILACSEKEDKKLKHSIRTVHIKSAEGRVYGGTLKHDDGENGSQMVGKLKSKQHDILKHHSDNANLEKKQMEGGIAKTINKISKPSKASLTCSDKKGKHLAKTMLKKSDDGREHGDTLEHHDGESGSQMVGKPKSKQDDILKHYNSDNANLEKEQIEGGIVKSINKIPNPSKASLTCSDKEGKHSAKTMLKKSDEGREHEDTLDHHDGESGRQTVGKPKSKQDGTLKHHDTDNANLEKKQIEREIVKTINKIPKPSKASLTYSDKEGKHLAKTMLKKSDEGRGHEDTLEHHDGESGNQKVAYLENKKTEREIINIIKIVPKPSKAISTCSEKEDKTSKHLVETMYNKPDEGREDTLKHEHDKSGIQKIENLRSRQTKKRKNLLKIKTYGICRVDTEKNLERRKRSPRIASKVVSKHPKCCFLCSTTKTNIHQDYCEDHKELENEKVEKETQNNAETQENSSRNITDIEKQILETSEHRVLDTTDNEEDIGDTENYFDSKDFDKEIKDTHSINRGDQVLDSSIPAINMPSADGQQKRVRSEIIPTSEKDHAPQTEKDGGITSLEKEGASERGSPRKKYKKYDGVESKVRKSRHITSKPEISWKTIDKTATEIREDIGESCSANTADDLVKIDSEKGDLNLNCFVLLSDCTRITNRKLSYSASDFIKMMEGSQKRKYIGGEGNDGDEIVQLKRARKQGKKRTVAKRFRFQRPSLVTADATIYTNPRKHDYQEDMEAKRIKTNEQLKTRSRVLHKKEKPAENKTSKKGQSAIRNTIGILKSQGCKVQKTTRKRVRFDLSEDGQVTSSRRLRRNTTGMGSILKIDNQENKNKARERTSRKRFIGRVKKREMIRTRGYKGKPDLLSNNTEESIKLRKPRPSLPKKVESKKSRLTRQCFLTGVEKTQLHFLKEEIENSEELVTEEHKPNVDSDANKPKNEKPTNKEVAERPKVTNTSNDFKGDIEQSQSEDDYEGFPLVMRIEPRGYKPKNEKATNKEVTERPKATNTSNDFKGDIEQSQSEDDYEDLSLGVRIEPRGYKSRPVKHDTTKRLEYERSGEANTDTNDTKSKKPESTEGKGEIMKPSTPFKPSIQILATLVEQLKSRIK